MKAFGAWHDSAGDPSASWCSSEHGYGTRSSRGSGEAGHSGNGSVVTTGYDEVAMAMIRAKSVSFPSIRVVGRLIGLPAVTKRRDEARTMARCVTELQ